jgi:hypothetical protein
MKKKLQKRFYCALKSILVLTPLLFASKAEAQCSVSISIDSTILCYGDSTGALSLIPPQAGAPLMISEVDRNSPDLIEIHNVTGASFDATGYYVACSDDYTNINVGNALVWNLTGSVPAGWVDYRDDAGGANYWGNNLFFNGTSSGWVAICDPSHNIIDIVFWDWNAADIATFAPVVAGNTLLLNPANWIGDGFNGGCGIGAMTRSTNLENNDALDWSCGATPTPGVSNMTVTPVSTVPIVSTTWSTGETTSSINNLGAGTYILTVVDSLGCTAIDTAWIIQPTQISASSSVTDVTCFGDTNGTAILTPAGGSGTITIDWGVSNPLMLPAGYTPYTLTDSLGCSASDSVLINTPASLVANLVSGSIPCFGDTTGGMVGANVTGGVPGYTYIWSNGDTTSTVTNLAAGWYNVSILDTNGCSVVDSIEVTEPAMIVLSGVPNDEILGSDGSIDLTVTGGTAPYSFTWTNGAPSIEDPSGLVAGSYDVTVTDSNGCIMTGTYIVGSQVGINELSELQFSVFPNPSNGSFEVLVDPSTGSSRIDVLNSLGQVIYTNIITDSTHLVNLQSAEAGIYFVRLNNSRANNVIRILVK